MDETSRVTAGKTRRSLEACLGAGALALALVGPWASLGSNASAAEHPPVNVTVQDFKIHTSVKSTEAGTVTLHVANHGPSTHEFNVDRTSLDPAHLPLGPDGLTVNEASPDLHRMGSIEALRLGDSGDLTLRLPPGHYALWCNLEGHYLGGMHASLDVTAKR